MDSSLKCYSFERKYIDVTKLIGRLLLHEFARSLSEPFKSLTVKVLKGHVSQVLLFKVDHISKEMSSSRAFLLETLKKYRPFRM